MKNDKIIKNEEFYSVLSIILAICMRFHKKIYVFFIAIRNSHDIIVKNLFGQWSSLE